jgi:hypothetical protein
MAETTRLPALPTAKASKSLKQTKVDDSGGTGHQAGVMQGLRWVHEGVGMALGRRIHC